MGFKNSTSSTGAGTETDWGSGTQYATTSSKNTPPSWVTSAYKDLFKDAGKLADKKYTPYTGGFTSDQKQAFKNIQGLKGVGDTNFSAANTAYNSGSKAYNSALGAYGASSAAYKNAMTPSYQRVNDYINPYVQNVVNATMANMQESNARQQQDVLGNLAAKGALGGNRTGVAQAELARQQNLANNQTISGLWSDAYAQALGAAQAQQGIELQGAQGYSGVGAGYSGVGAGYGNIGAGQTGLGQTKMDTGLAQAAAQLGAGTQQQQFDYQQYLNKQAYPFQQQSWYSNILSGAPNAGGTTTATKPAGNVWSDIIGTALQFIPFFADGGVVRPRYADGGVTPYYTGDNREYPSAILDMAPYGSLTDTPFKTYIPASGEGRHTGASWPAAVSMDDDDAAYDSQKRADGGVVRFMTEGRPRSENIEDRRGERDPIEELIDRLLNDNDNDLPQMPMPRRRANAPFEPPSDYDPMTPYRDMGVNEHFAARAHGGVVPHMADGGRPQYTVTPYGTYAGDLPLGDYMSSKDTDWDSFYNGITPSATVPAPALPAPALKSNSVKTYAIDINGNPIFNNGVAPSNAVSFAAPPASETAREQALMRSGNAALVPLNNRAALANAGIGFMDAGADATNPERLPHGDPNFAFGYGPSDSSLYASTPSGAVQAVNALASGSVAPTPRQRPSSLSAVLADLFPSPADRNADWVAQGPDMSSLEKVKQSGIVSNGDFFPPVDSRGFAEITIRGGDPIPVPHPRPLGKTAPTPRSRPLPNYRDSHPITYSPHPENRTVGSGKSVNGVDMAFMPRSVQDSSRWNTGYADGGVVGRRGYAPGGFVPYTVGDAFVTAPREGYSQNVGDAFRSLSEGNGLNLSPDFKQAMMSAGAGMASSTSPFALKALGEGTQKGVDTWNKRQEQERENAQARANIANQTRQTAVAEQLAGPQADLMRAQANQARYKIDMTAGGYSIVDLMDPGHPTIIPFDQVFGTGIVPGQEIDYDPSQVTQTRLISPDNGRASTNIKLNPEIGGKVMGDAYDRTAELMNAAQAADAGDRQLIDLRHQLEQLPEGGWNVAGAGFETRMEIARTADTLLRGLGAKLPDDFAQDLASMEDISKISRRLSYELKGTLGGTAASIFDGAMASVPSGENTPAGAARLVDALLATNQAVRDKGYAAQDWFERYGTLQGFDQAFYAINPPALYSLKAIVPDEWIVELRGNPSPENQEAFDKAFGEGAARVALSGYGG